MKASCHLREFVERWRVVDLSRNLIGWAGPPTPCRFNAHISISSHLPAVRFDNNQGTFTHPNQEGEVPRYECRLLLSF